MNQELEWLTNEEELKLRFLMGNQIVDMQRTAWEMLKQTDEEVPAEVIERFKAGVKMLKEQLEFVIVPEDFRV